MDTGHGIPAVLNIPKNHLKWLSNTRAVCLVPVEWLQRAVDRTLPSYTWQCPFCPSDCEQYLALSKVKIPLPWKRICVKVIRKSTWLVQRLPDMPLSHSSEQSSILGHLSEISRERYHSQWSKAYYAVHGGKTQNPNSLQQKSDVIYQYLHKLYPQQIYKLQNKPSLNLSNSINSGYNILDVLEIYETGDAVYIIEPFILCNIQNVIAYSPAIFKSSSIKPLFILYQLLHIIKDLHSIGLVLGDLKLRDILCDEKLWISVSGLHFEKVLKIFNERKQNVSNASIDNTHKINQIATNKEFERPCNDTDQDQSDSLYQTVLHPVCSRLMSESDSLVEEAKSFMHSAYKSKYSINNLPTLVEDWVHHRITNFKYLMVLNHLAGRRMYDPNHHPVLPWVMEFETDNHTDFKLRDLTKSKYRLNKGDSQLDLTYEYCVTNIPHHVSDVLSDITYYVYKARRTSKTVLCSHVRPKWVPNEYPSSMTRMYNWTPDECIPEFYVDPLIFTSIHEDLPDIELPAWCNNAEEFIVKHMEVLESDKVSEFLNHWIDLTFGYKLSGSVAVKEKNINLQLVDDHKTVTNYGVVQLFTEPHPYRIPHVQKNRPEPPKIAKNVLWSQIHGLEDLDKKQSSQRPETATIYLQKAYDPLSSLNQLEALCNFAVHNMGDIPREDKQKTTPGPDNSSALVTRDMTVFGCIMCELFLQSVLYTEVSDVPLDRRLKLIRRYCIENRAALPRSIDQAINVLLKPNLSTDTDPSISSCTPDDMPQITPSQLLSPFINILPFPNFFPALYENICHLKQIDRKLEKIELDLHMNAVDKQKLLKITAREKVTIMQKYLENNHGRLGEEGLEILLPHVEELFCNENTSVQAAWSLFNLIGQQVDKKIIKSQFLPHLVKLYHIDNPTPKFMKIYHKSFIVQLIIRLGLDSYLSNFSTTLVEAVAGYKDYVFEDLYNEQSEYESVIDKSSSMHLPVVTEEDARSRSSSKQEPSASENYNSNMTPDDVDDIEDEMEDNVSRDKSLSDESIVDEEKISLQSGDGTEEEILKESEDEISVQSSSATVDDDELQFQYSEEVDEEDFSEKSITNSTYKNKMAAKLQAEDRSNNYGSHMIRSETEEFARTMSEKVASEVVNIRDVSMETIKWLSQRIGPFLTAKYLSRNLLRMLVLCYLGEEQIMSIEERDDRLRTSRMVLGDRHADRVLTCLLHIASLYGEQVILIQYLPSVVDLIYAAKKRLTSKAEAGLISSLVLLRSIIRSLADKTLMDILQDKLLREILQPVIRVVSSPSHNFSGGSTMRTIICHKLIDVIYIIGIRIGFEMTRNHMTKLLQDFFVCFNPVNNVLVNDTTDVSGSPRPLKQVLSNASIDESFCNIKVDDSSPGYTFGTPVSLGKFSPQFSPVKRRAPHSLSVCGEEKDETSPENVHGKEDIKKEMADVFNSELAMASYVPFCRIFGSIYMEQHLPNDDLIRQLCSQYDQNSDEPMSNITKGIPIVEDKEGTTVELQGNKIKIETTSDVNLEMMSIGPMYRNSKILSIDPETTKSNDMNRNTRRHLRGNWFIYWEHELGLSERETLFNFKQIKLQTFEGHAGSIKTLTVLDNENSFISSSKDRTVKLWSIKSFGDGQGKSRCQWTYREHRKSVYSVVFLESVRLVTSCDSSVHIWDPFTTDTVRTLDSTRYTPVTSMAMIPEPSSVVLTANTDGLLRFLDLRTVGYAHEFRCTSATAGLIRCMAVSPDSQWVAIGFSSGIMSLLNLKTGILLGTWKAHEGEIIQMKAYSKNKFISCSYDQTVKVWNAEEIKDVTLLKGHTEPVHCIALYKNQVVTATTGNKIGVHSSADDQSISNSEKLRSDEFKGVLTSMALLPLNKLLLLGADNGSVRLFC